MRGGVVAAFAVALVGYVFGLRWEVWPVFLGPLFVSAAIVCAAVRKRVDDSRRLALGEAPPRSLKGQLAHLL